MAGETLPAASILAIHISTGQSTGVSNVDGRYMLICIGPTKLPFPL
jgi:hypothetical protein